MKNFDRNHHGYHSLRSAHKAMVNIVDYINEAKRRKENAQRIVDLQNSVTGWAGQGVGLYVLHEYSRIVSQARLVRG